MKNRTIQQNKALHKYYRMLSEALNDAGLDMKAVLRPDIDIPWTESTVKKHLWKPIQIAMIDKESTTELEKEEVNRVYKVLDRHLAAKLGLSVPFPTREEDATQSN